MPPADYWEDEWYNTDREVRGGARHVRAPSASSRRVRDDDFGARRTSEFLLAPESRTTTSLHRTRSQGHAPAPNVTIYNTTRMDNESSPNVRTEQKSPLVNPYAEPRGRSRRMPGEWSLEDEIAELRLDVAKQARSRSRSKHHHDDHHGHDYDHWKLEEANRRIKEQEELKEIERREELIKKKMELKYIRDRQERELEEARIAREEDRLRKEWELKLEREERKRKEREEDAEREKDRLKKDWEYKLERETRKKEEERRAEEEERKRLIAESMAKADKRAREQEEERQRIIAENTLKLEKAERERRAAQQKAVDDFNKERAEKEAQAKAEQDRIVAQYEAKKVKDAAEEKRKREELIMQLRIEEEHRKQKEKEEWDRFLLKQKQKEEEEKAAKEKQEKELEEAMRKRLAHFGFQDNQIQAMIRPEEAAKLQQGMSPANPLRLTHQPTYVKVHKEHLAVDTLVYYDIPYEVDRADPNYIIILREMEPRETEILFEHTRRLRTRGGTRLLIEERDNHGKNDYAWVRRRKPSRSPSRRRSSPKRVVGIKEMFF
ncbi:hypothetical protein DPSP01_011890 [Paraphaeosphaeria sporulosa]|uniref:Uncharacterized protein n=1 Tax=Paraphaeosphaeria sporulosa TaxID=1460663 RepID=A0A177CZW7_9PLEO|nr:uncharacterized protein CC84DRAFT_1254883 [Paraphaeosphaeria sporulosa]OAG12681.1 hypothetical protein CC84DRAFT_1254883 [Paraphaeosphaeria sporulosa]